MPYWIVKQWKKHQFKVLVVLSFIALIVAWVYKDNSVGTYSETYYYEPKSTKRKSITFSQVSRGEKECRRVMETLFDRPFPNCRPLFLYNNVTGKPLEIDCFNQDMKLGIEYNGRQHYMFVKGMHANNDAFRTQQYRDDMKQRLCDDNNITLITVPYTIETDKIEDYLKTELRKYKYL